MCCKLILSYSVGSSVKIRRNSHYRERFDNNREPEDLVAHYYLRKDFGQEGCIVCFR